MTLVFLKLGGSLITDKTRPFTPRLKLIADIANQIANALKADANLKIVLGHGSGSFGHETASKYDLLQGIKDKKTFNGFAEVWYQASRLNHIVMEILHQAGISAMSFPPSASVATKDRIISTWDIAPIQIALEKELLPVIHGDVVFDTSIGGTILSTEMLFAYLTPLLKPQTILLAGLEKGVWVDFPERKRLYNEITPKNFDKTITSLGKALAKDVTGGMQSKVKQMVHLVEHSTEIKVLIFSGQDPDNIHRALLGKTFGTVIRR